MDRWNGRVALVTGASMGVGRGICRLLVSRGMKVVGCARSLEKLEELATELSGPGEFYPIRCDLRDQGEIATMFQGIAARWDGVDVCINNAALAFGPSIIDGDSREWETMWQVNVMALCLCAQAAVKSMRDRGVDDGHVININSISGHRVGKSHFYSATKYAVTALTEGIRWELRDINSHIRITSVSPGLINTHFFYTPMGESEAQKFYNRNQCLQPEDLAQTVEYVLATPPHVQINEVTMRPTERIKW